MNEEIKDKIREICIHHGDDGTSGWLLDEDRFAKIFALVDKQSEGFKKIIEDILEKNRFEQSGITLEERLESIKESLK